MAMHERVPTPTSKPQYNNGIFSGSSHVHNIKEKMLCFFEDNHDELTLYQDLADTCTALMQDTKNVEWLFQVFSLCSWIDRQRSPIISKLFHELIVAKNNNSCSKTCNSSLLLCRLESTCQDFLQVLTLLGMPSPLHFRVASLMCSMSRLDTVHHSFRVEVMSFLQELTRAFWPYCMLNTAAPSLWDNDGFVDALADVLTACGESMETQCPVNMDRTFQMVDRQLVSNGVSPYSRYRLLEVRELRTLGWKMTDSAKEYYKTAYKKYIGSLKRHMAQASFGANIMEESRFSEGPEAPLVLRIHESSLGLDNQDMQERGDSDSSMSDSVFTEEDERELEAQLASYDSSMANSYRENYFRDTLPAAKVSISTFLKGKVVTPRRPHKSDSTAFSGMTFDKRRVFSANTKDPRNPEFTVGEHSAEDLHREDATERCGEDSAGAKKEAEDSKIFTEGAVSNLPFTSATVPAETTPGAFGCSSEKLQGTAKLQAPAEETSSFMERPAKLTANSDLHWRERGPEAENSTSNLPNATETSSVKELPEKLNADTDSSWRVRNIIAGSNGNPLETDAHSASLPWACRTSGGFGQPPRRIQRNLSVEAPRSQGYGLPMPRRSSTGGFPGPLLCKVTTLEEKSSPSCQSATCSSTMAYSRSFLLSCAKSPPALQRPADLAIDRDEDWVQMVVTTKTHFPSSLTEPGLMCPYYTDQRYHPGNNLQKPPLSV